MTFRLILLLSALVLLPSVSWAFGEPSGGGGDSGGTVVAF